MERNFVVAVVAEQKQEARAKLLNSGYSHFARIQRSSWRQKYRYYLPVSIRMIHHHLSHVQHAMPPGLEKNEVDKIRTFKLDPADENASALLLVDGDDRWLFL